MNFLKQMLQNLSLSISHPKNYILFINHKLRQSLSFYFFWYLIIGIAVGIFSASVTLPNSIGTLNSLLTDLDNNFPQDYTFSWTNQELTTTPSQIQVQYPPQLGDSDDENLVFFDTSVEDTQDILATIPASSTLVVSKNQLGITTPNGITQRPLSELPLFDQDFMVDRTNISSIIGDIRNWVTETTATMQLFIVLISPFVLSGYRFWILLIDSLLGFLIFKAWGTPISYKKVLQLSIHIAVPVEIIHQLAKMIYKSMPVHLYSLGFWIMFSLVIYNLRNVKAISRVSKKN